MHGYSNWPKKAFIWFAARTEGLGVALYALIYGTYNSLLTESMVDHDTLLGKDLGLDLGQLNIL